MASRTYKDILNPSLKDERKSIYVAYVLHILQAASLVTLASLLNPPASFTLFKKLFKGHQYEKRLMQQALSRLESRGLVKRRRRDDGNEYLYLSQSGEEAFIRSKGREMFLKPDQAAWDGKWRIVLFDIIEDKKNIRDALRRHLHRMKFYPLQKSVFVTPYDCEEEIGFLEKFYEGESEICLITAASLGKKEKIIRRYFGV